MVFKIGAFDILLCALVFGFCDRTVAALSDGYLDAVDLGQLTIVALVAVAVVALNPRY